MSDRKMVGVEVLLRWQHPALGAILPSIFIEGAEQSGLIEVIGPKILRAACLDAVQWPQVTGEAPAVRLGQRIAAATAQRRHGRHRGPLPRANPACRRRACTWN